DGIVKSRSALRKEGTDSLADLGPAVFEFGGDRNTGGCAAKREKRKIIVIRHERDELLRAFSRVGHFLLFFHTSRSIQNQGHVGSLLFEMPQTSDAIHDFDRWYFQRGFWLLWIHTVLLIDRIPQRNIDRCRAESVLQRLLLLRAIEQVIEVLL